MKPTTFPAALAAACLLTVLSQAPANLSAGEAAVIDDSKNPQAPAPEEEMTLFPVPDYTGGLFTRPALTGDWGGLRTSFAEDHGVQLEAAVNQFYQGLVDGGRPNADSSWQYSGTADYTLKLDTGKAGLWPGGLFIADVARCVE